MLVHSHFPSSNALERFILDKCKQSVHFALQVNWLFASSMCGAPQVVARSESLQAHCEIATVNGNLDQVQHSSLHVVDHCYESASELSRMQTEGTLKSYTKPASDSPASSRNQSDDPSEGVKVEEFPVHIQPDEVHDMIAIQALDKLGRCEYFYQVLHFVEDLGKISEKLRHVPVPLRRS
jgi:hypothetical protein